jgi:protein SCO1
MRLLSAALTKVRDFIEGGGFPATALCLMAFYELLILGMLATPPHLGTLGPFAEEFRVWCFGLDPATGGLQWAYVMAMTVPQLMLAALLLLLWWEPLRMMLARPRRLVAPVLAAGAITLAAAAGLASLWSAPNRGELPFPAEALRTAYPAPELALVNQVGEPVDLAKLRGNVVLLTAIYATCGHTCPLLLAQAKQAVASLEDSERASLRVVAVTLDPEHDTTDVLAQRARMQALPAPLYNLVTGEPARVERVLDAMDVTRKRDAKTGLIEHASLFLLVDREGKVAYRLGLGPHQERWLATALRVLLREPLASGQGDVRNSG